jgi:hypothetical protein
MAKMMQATGWWKQLDDCLDRSRGSIRKEEERRWREDANLELSEEDILQDLYYGTD